MSGAVTLPMLAVRCIIIVVISGAHAAIYSHYNLALLYHHRGYERGSRGDGVGVLPAVELDPLQEPRVLPPRPEPVIKNMLLL